LFLNIVTCESMKVKTDIYQSNYLTNNYLPFTKHESSVFAVLIGLLKKDQLEYQINLKDLLKYIRIEDSNYKQLISALKGLSTKQITFTYQAERIKQRITNVIDYVEFPMEENITINDTITIRLTTGIIPHLFNLKETGYFTVYQLESFLQLQSTYSRKLYTLFAEYKENKILQRTKEELQTVLGTNYKEFKVLFSKVIKPSIAEILSTTNINNIKIEAVKQGKKITSYKFRFDWHDRQIQMPILPTSLPLESLVIYERLISEYQITNHQAEQIILNVPIKQISKILYTIQMADINKKIHTNKGAYAIGVFNKTFKGLNL
jgi:plasmid replication initiation protein